MVRDYALKRSSVGGSDTESNFWQEDHYFQGSRDCPDLSQPTSLVNGPKCYICDGCRKNCPRCRPMGPNLVRGVDKARHPDGTIPDGVNWANTVSPLPRNAEIDTGASLRTESRAPSRYLKAVTQIRSTVDALRSCQIYFLTGTLVQISSSVDQLMKLSGESGLRTSALIQGLRDARHSLLNSAPWVDQSSTVKRLATELGILTDLMGHFLQSQELSVPEASVSGPISSAPAYPVVPPPPGRAPGEDERKPFSNLM